jgi:hypothetical protein
MASKIIFESVGCGGTYENGNMTVLKSTTFVAIVDINNYKDKEGNFASSWELVKKHARRDLKNGRFVYVIDFLVITHGDADHCGGFETIATHLESGDLIIGCLAHQGFDRKKVEDIDLSEFPDYAALDKEINKRNNNGFGNYCIKLSSGMSEKDLAVSVPSDFSFYVLNPPSELSPEDFNTSVNDYAIVLIVSFCNTTILLCSDTTAKTWMRIKSNKMSLEKIRDKIDFLVLAHHGSATFFCESREAVIAAKESKQLENYKILNDINPSWFVLPAETKFPEMDFSGENPPHYAAKKWYKNWLVEKGRCSKADNDPALIMYTSERPIIIDAEQSHSLAQSGFSGIASPSYRRPYGEVLANE